LQLEELAVGECSAFSDWELIGAIIPPVGIPSLPEGWAALRRLRRLALRGHNILRTLPDWLARSVLSAAVRCCEVFAATTYSSWATDCCSQLWVAASAPADLSHSCC
jgi:hypothetical protein